MTKSCKDGVEKMRTRKQERASAERNGCKQEKAENTCFDDLYEQLTRNPALEAVKHLQKLAQGDPSAVGFRTGFDFDEIIMGLQPGDLFVLAARPSIGKTSLMLNIATNIALGNERIPIGIFSFETSTRAVIIRMLSSLTRISFTDFLKNRVSKEQWCKVLDASNRIHEAQIVIDDTGEMDISELRVKARLMRSRYGVQAIFIDYLQLIRDSRRNSCREWEITEISHSLKAMARELAIPVIVLVQLSRQADCQVKPTLSSIRESGGVEQVADMIAILHRCRKDFSYENEPLSAELNIAKNRRGSCGTVNLKFFPQYTLFENAPQGSEKKVNRSGRTI